MSSAISLPSGTNKLTKQEHRVLGIFLSDPFITIPEIAEILVVAHRTAQCHLCNIFKKHGVSGSTARRELYRSYIPSKPIQLPEYA